MKTVFVRNLLFAVVAAMAMGAIPAQADDDNEETYGRELMTEQERMEHRRQMRNLEGGEREGYRKEHHEKMQKRAREQGKTIPDEPGERGKGMQQGKRQGKGMGR